MNAIISSLDSLVSADAAAAFLQVVMIDLVLAGDNAVAVGLAAAGLPQRDRHRVILWGLVAAVALRIVFALITVKLLEIIGLLFAGGLLLLWVCWKMWRDLHEHAAAEAAASEGGVATGTKKTFFQAFLTILVADVSMSLDNVLAVAGAAHEHPVVLVAGLLLSIALMGLAANWIAKLLHRHRWIGVIGLLIVLYVALHMMWRGHRDTVIALDRVDEYNRLAPDLIDISPEEIATEKRKLLIGKDLANAPKAPAKNPAPPAP